MNDSKTYVTRPWLPPLSEFLPYLEEIWRNKTLTNNGPFHQRFEAALCEHLGVEHVSLFCNGTIALVTALQALGIEGEVITTPYSFVATVHSLVWNRIEPVFVDIDPHSCNLDPRAIEAAITPRTTAILPVHCYGTPCAVDEIQAVADRHGLRVLYDAAHAFGVRQHGRSLLAHGDMSVLSFHATKVFQTFEGGAVICRDARSKAQVDYLKNFGFANEVTVVATGINGKMSEVNAAFGLLQLEHVDQALALRAAVDARYREQLALVEGVHCLPRAPVDTDNHAYFPVLVTAGETVRDRVYAYLRQHGVFARRYFYPLISDFPMYRNLPSAAPERLPVARSVAQQILCLPIFPDLPLDKVDEICRLLALALESRHAA